MLAWPPECDCRAGTPPVPAAHSERAAAFRKGVPGAAGRCAARGPRTGHDTRARVPTKGSCEPHSTRAPPCLGLARRACASKSATQHGVLFVRSYANARTRRRVWYPRAAGEGRRRNAVAFSPRAADATSAGVMHPPRNQCLASLHPGAMCDFLCGSLAHARSNAASGPAANERAGGGERPRGGSGSAALRRPSLRGAAARDRKCAIKRRHEMDASGRDPRSERMRSLGGGRCGTVGRFGAR